MSELSDLKKEMSPEQLAFLKSKTLAAKMSPVQWLTFFDKLQAYDQLADVRRKTLGTVAAILTPIAVIATFFGTVTLGPTGFVLCLIFLLIPAGIFLVLWQMYRSVDIPNRLHTILIPILSLLREEMDPEAALTLQLDLTGPMTKSKVVNTERVAFGNPEIDHTFYEDRWMGGSGEFADGTRLQFSVEDSVRQTSKRRTNARGKTKRKTKVKIKHRLFDICLQPKVGEYELVGGPRGANFKIKTKEGEKRNTIRVRRPVQIPNIEALETQDVLESFVNCLAHAYRQVQRGGPADG